MTLLNDRFEVVRELGRGGQGTTHFAIDRETGEEVALKELDFRHVSDWKAHELFEREGETLCSLQHPAIPRYVDAFVVEEASGVRLCLVQEYVEGITLLEELHDGRRWSADDLLDDATQLLDILVYLHELSPPVVHRDIKPSNIIRRPDGTLALIDFGAAQNALPETVGGSTVIGTPGYMAIEQLMGRAVPASDVYALGATLIQLATRTEPSKLPTSHNKLIFRDRAEHLPDTLLDVLDKMTEPSAERRYPNGAAARRALIDPEASLKPGELERDSLISSYVDDAGALELVTKRYGGAQTLVQVAQGPQSLTLRCTSPKAADPQAAIGCAVDAIGAAALVLSVRFGWGAIGFVVLSWLALRWALTSGSRSVEERFDVLSLEVGAEQFKLVNEGRVTQGDTSKLAGVSLEDGALKLLRTNDTPLVLLDLAEEELEKWPGTTRFLDRTVKTLAEERSFSTKGS